MALISTAGNVDVEEEVEGLGGACGSGAAGVTDCWKEEVTPKHEEG